jgi:hypothetical protein
MRQPRRPFVAAALPALLVCAVSCAPNVGEARGRWQRTIDTACLVWDPLPQPDETITWSGACVNGEADGQGTEVSRYRVDGEWKEERYTGSMRRGRLYGHGTLTYDNGDRYEGEFVQSRRVGQGRYTYANGDYYEGDFRNDKRTGHGRFTYLQGGHYEGGFVDGLFDGAGTFSFPDGARYEGIFRGGMANGLGTLTGSSGDVITGIWSNGCLRQGSRVATVGTTEAKCGFK